MKKHSLKLLSVEPSEDFTDDITKILYCIFGAAPTHVCLVIGRDDMIRYMAYAEDICLDEYMITYMFDDESWYITTVNETIIEILTGIVWKRNCTY